MVLQQTIGGKPRECFFGNPSAQNPIKFADFQGKGLAAVAAASLVAGIVLLSLGNHSGIGGFVVSAGAGAASFFAFRKRESMRKDSGLDNTPEEFKCKLKDIPAMLRLQASLLKQGAFSLELKK